MNNILIISEAKFGEVNPHTKTVGVGVKALKKDFSIAEAGPEDYSTLLSVRRPEAVICSVKGGISSAVSYIKSIKGFDENLPIIIISSQGGVEDAVSIMKAGAYDYFQSPVDVEKLRLSLNNAIRLYNLTKRVFLLEHSRGWEGKFDDIIGCCPKMQEIFQLIALVAMSNATVLIMGESGTGKELVAHAIHKHSKRAAGPFVDINCGAIPRELLENELFGHERGAYTGADKRYIGSCERAHGGTLFLDEICEMEPALQVKILRLLQDRSFMRIGGNEKIEVDIRFVAATNRNIADEVARGAFREDLYYRLNVIPMTIPPMRDRPEDIPLLAKCFLEEFSAKNEKIFVDFSPDAMECLLSYNWPGNVREMENTIERVVVLYNDSRVKLKHLPPHIQNVSRDTAPRKTAALLGGQGIVPLDMMERYAIEAALQRYSWDIKAVADKLKVGQATLYRKIKQYGLTR